jgi:hypothetical protein
LKSDIARFELGLEKCIRRAAAASNPELAETWQTLAESYRHLIETSERERHYNSWEWNRASELALK